MTATIRVAMADDHPLMLKAMYDLFRGEPDFTVVAQGHDGEAALRIVRDHRPDILVLDVRMPLRDGISVLREIRKQDLPTRVVLLAAALDDDELVEATRLGVGGVVLKEMAPRLLVQCIRKVHAGEPWLERRAVARAFEAREIGKILTPRELEIVRMTTSGLQTKTIVERLNISEGTVKTHLHAIYKKLQVRSRADLILYCKNKGIV